MCADEALDELVWAIDHLADVRADVRCQAGAIVDAARQRVAAWHERRAAARAAWRERQ